MKEPDYTLILTADPDYLAPAMQELATAQTGSRQVAELAPGVVLAELTVAFQVLAGKWRAAPPIFVRHIAPAELRVSIDDESSAVDLLRAAVLDHFSSRLPSQDTFSVQTRVLAGNLRPFDINNALAAALGNASGAALDVRHAAQVVSCTLAEFRGHLTAFLGLSPAVDNLSDWAGGMRRFAREKGQISRAEFKLLEALEVFQVTLPARGSALDLGAAPGGWTRVLRQHGLSVVAVDPAALHPSLAADKGVEHVWTTAEDYLRTLNKKFEVIVNDMRMDARDSARVMADYGDKLYSGGLALMTCKLPERYQPRILEHALTILSARYFIKGVRQLFHNRNEVTVHLAARR
ncbi:MAG: SAM-dependent methyltransferase [Anaerolineae bacterium]